MIEHILLGLAVIVIISLCVFIYWITTSIPNFLPW